MANSEHAAILERGSDVWNKWRAENPNVSPDLENVEITGEELRGVNLGRANLFGACLVCNDLTGADFRGAILFEAHLYESVLNDADLSDARIEHVSLNESKLNNTKFNRSYLVNVNFSLAELNGTDFSEATMLLNLFGDNDLRKVRGLDTIKHSGPSTIGVDTVFRSNGEIPEGFLRGCGVAEDLITYMKSLVARPVEFYSCFVSFSSGDQDFAERLCSKLRAEGVRCWFAPEDLKIGEEFRTRIDESIRIYDKLLVVLSKNSISSRWVQKEVETAFEKERSKSGLVLFPIRLDEVIMDTDKAWAADIRRTRHIGDFRNWKDNNAFLKAFERLMRDLRASATPST